MVKDWANEKDTKLFARPSWERERERQCRGANFWKATLPLTSESPSLPNGSLISFVVVGAFVRALLRMHAA